VSEAEVVLARERFPTPVPPKRHHTSTCRVGCSQDHVAEYDGWLRRMGLWAFQFGPALLERAGA